jgi:anionic cell wall polymer biosynthesis LytR-Cps2A-Psr (LCP) family protein
LKKNVILICSIAIILIICVSVIHVYGVITRNAVEKLYSEKKLINVLIAGTNSKKTSKFNFFAIATFNPETKYIGITYLPPSYRVELSDSENEFEALCNIDFSNYEIVRKSLFKNLKLNVPFYIAVNSNDVSRITDLIGGLDLFVLDQYSDLSINAPGSYYFDGDKILQYINKVENNSIYVKYDRIQDIMMTVFANKKNYSKFLSIKHIPKLVSGIKTNMYPQEILSLAEVLEEDSFILSTIVPGSFKNKYYVVDDIGYQIYESNFLSQIILGKESEYSIKVKIINATSQSGLARKMRNYLNRDVINVLEFSSSSYGRFEESVIIGKRGDGKSVKKISDLTGITKICYVTDNTQLNNVMVIIGNDISNIQSSIKE